MLELTRKNLPPPVRNDTNEKGKTTAVKIRLVRIGHTFNHAPITAMKPDMPVIHDVTLAISQFMSGSINVFNIS